MPKQPMDRTLLGAAHRRVRQPPSNSSRATFELTMRTEEAVSIVLCGPQAQIELLAFRHPLAGIQLVKGSVEADETADAAALREITEEAGLAGVTVVRNLGTWFNMHAEQLWHLRVVSCDAELPVTWDHATQDGGGLTFSFFWPPLRAAPSDEWHPRYRDVLQEIRVNRVRSRCEHFFHVVKRLWGFVKVRDRGLEKNTARVFTAFALADLSLVRRKLSPQGT
jgi:8-oxo-dGTP pyrophosphatase MutT (NUDIX family)